MLDSLKIRKFEALLIHKGADLQDIARRSEDGADLQYTCEQVLGVCARLQFETALFMTNEERDHA